MKTGKINFNKIMLLLLGGAFILSITSCTSTRTNSIQEVQSSEIKTGLKFYQYDKFYVSGQPTAVDFIKLRQEGFVAIVNFRKHLEDNKYNEKWERNNSLLSGMSYYQMGHDLKNDELNQNFITKLVPVIKDELARGKILFHCDNGERAAMWLIAYLYDQHKITKASGEKLIQQFAIKDEVVIAKLQAFFAKHP
jgi:protein tyrosine phosphatase (PTP) superfamily phosphohydrolase (DUF442 family)